MSENRLQVWTLPRKGHVFHLTKYYFLLCKAAIFYCGTNKYVKKVTLYLKSSQPWTIFNHNMKSIWTIFVVDKKSQSAGVAMSSVTSHAGLIVVKDAFPPLHLVLLGDNWGDGQGDVATDVPGQGDIPGCRLWTSHHWAPNVPGASLHEVCTFRMSQLHSCPSSQGHRMTYLNTLNRNS